VTWDGMSWTSPGAGRVEKPQHCSAGTIAGQISMRRKGRLSLPLPDREHRYHCRSQQTCFPCIPQTRHFEKVQQKLCRMPSVRSHPALCSGLRIPGFPCKPGRHVLCYLCPSLCMEITISQGDSVSKRQLDIVSQERRPLSLTLCGRL